MTKWDGTFLLSIRGTYNWYLLEAHDLGNMIDAFISVWKCVENFLEPFKAKLFIFFMKSHVKMMYFHNMTDPKNMLFFSIFTKGCPKSSWRDYTPEIFQTLIFESKKWHFFGHLFLGNFAQKAIRDEGVFTSVNCIFKVVNFGFPNSILQKKVCGNFVIS